MLAFIVVWIGQLISVLASSMSLFALTIWIYQQSGSATALGVVSTSFLLPFLLLSPLAGAMVDRYNRKLMMMVSDLAAVLSTTGVLVLHLSGNLQVWHLAAAGVINGLGNTFQWPAYSAAISTMVPKEQYQRANGMMSLVESGPAVLAPILAGMLLPFFGLTGILVLDIATFFLAIAALLVVHIPSPVKTEEGQGGAGSIWKEAIYGFKYIFARRSLLGLLLFFLGMNFILGMAGPLMAPYILSKTGNSSAALGTVEAAWAIGEVVGGILVGVWGGLKRRINGIFLSEIMIGTFSLLLFGLGQALPHWVVTGALGALFFPLTNGASQAIWQAKVAPDVQGRVFSARRMIAWLMDPLTPILAGALADYVTEPAMQSDTWLAQAFGWLVGTSPGSGMALQFVLAGLAYLITAVSVYLFVPIVRNVEDILPDHDKMVQLADKSSLAQEPGLDGG